MEKSLFKNAIYKISLNFFNLVLPILVGMYVYRVLGNESIGRVKYGESIFNYLFIFATFGIYQYGLREVSRIKKDKQKVAQLFTSLFTFSIFTNAVTLIAYLLIAYYGYGNHYLFPILLIFSISFVMNIFYVEWLNEAFENYGFITIKTIIVKLIYIGLLFTLVKGPEDYLIFTALLVMTTSLNNILSFFYIKRHVPFDFSNLVIRPHLRPLFLVVIFMNGNILYGQLDIFMLGKYVSEKSVSFYVMSKQITTIISALMLSVVQVTIPRLSYLLGSADEKSYLELVQRIAKLYFAVLFPAAIGLFVISDLGVIAYGGKDFADAGPVLAVFSIYMIFVGTDNVLSNQVMYVKKKEHILVRFIVICGIINLLLNALFVYLDYFDARVAIATTGFSTFLLVCLEYYYVRRVIKLPLNLLTSSNLKYLLFSLSFIPISYGIRTFLSGTYVLFGTIVVVCLSLYVFLLWITKDEILFMILDKVKQKFPKLRI
ncbi:MULTISPECIES: oligosaccharide flippase family protein [unclassified Bacillus (in: firmicutes)]|uniref:oligosaccharide flippase family protein n=1 Tax=unclassified Bacillus (in: firmicutes) TaxID=185979 RepID=UPI0008E7EF8A|nr:MULTISPECIES: oligosaccharide flippase family protein [unclassified Bacillus (in: firmicutes)]SFB21124.1 Membrane protein involved in the export of O-antigen and teichoic acid [Bacillus sp. UNCCL13]SFQ90969.1 Membrane protein involved in the export of O-antigen and teichoic acid [Bacillus sp. cl95]